MEQWADMVVRGQNKASGPPTDATETGVLGALVIHAFLSKAASLARKGEYATAEDLLKQLVGGENENPSALDLLARIHAQQGRFSEAEAFWERALQLEPNNESYLAGLKRIARIRSRPLWVGILLPMGVAVFAILMVLFVGFAVRNQIVQLRESLLREVARANTATVGNVPSSPQIAIQLNGATVKTQQNALVVLFDEGLFLSRADLTSEAETLLSELGRQIKPHASNISVRIIGHTDDIPVSEGWIYRDNAALGIARAVTVADYLRNNAGLPVSQFLFQSVGESQPPYPNDTPANRLRNRTVVIRIYPAHDVVGENH